MRVRVATVGELDGKFFVAVSEQQRTDMESGHTKVRRLTSDVKFGFYDDFSSAQLDAERFKDSGIIPTKERIS